MDVRQARPPDAPLIFALALEEEAHLVKSSTWPARNGVMRTVRRAIAPLAFSGKLWIARDKSSVAILEAEPRQYVIGWDVTRLAVRGDRSRVLLPILQAATAYLQGRGVPRLFARCAENDRGALQAAGFHLLAHEYLLMGPEVAPVAGEGAHLPVDSRYRMPQDAWPLHQLESAVTPSLVRQLEGLTSLDWSHKSDHVSEIVVERDSRIVAWIGWGAKAHDGLSRVGLLVHPDHKEVGADLLGHALEQVGGRYRLFARVRDYQTEALAVLMDAGFTVAAEEALLVRHGRVEYARSRRPVHVTQVPGIPALHIRTATRPADLRT